MFLSSIISGKITSNLINDYLLKSERVNIAQSAYILSCQSVKLIFQAAIDFYSLEGENLD